VIINKEKRTKINSGKEE